MVGSKNGTSILFRKCSASAADIFEIPNYFLDILLGKGCVGWKLGASEVIDGKPPHTRFRQLIAAVEFFNGYEAATDSAIPGQILSYWKHW